MCSVFGIITFLLGISALGGMILTAKAEWAASCQGQVMWNVPDPASNKSCVMMTGVYRFIIPYQGKDSQIDYADIEIPDNSTVSGICGTNSSREQSITLTWSVDSDLDSDPERGVLVPVNNVVTFTFTRNSTTGSPDGVEGYFCLQKIKADLHSNTEQFPDTLEPGKIYSLDAFNMEVMATPLGMSFFCDSLQDYAIGNSTLRLQHTQFEIFHKMPVIRDGSNYNPKSYCLADGLRILVTAAVLMLLLISAGAFVIYLFRRNSKNSDYGEI